MHNLLLIQTFFFWCLSRPVLLLLPWHPAEEQASTNYGWTRPLNEMEIDYNCNWFHNGGDASIPHQNLQAAQMPLLLGKKAINVINKNQFFFYNSLAKQYSNGIFHPRDWLENFSRGAKSFHFSHWDLFITEWACELSNEKIEMWKVKTLQAPWKI